MRRLQHNEQLPSVTTRRRKLHRWWYITGGQLPLLQSSAVKVQRSTGPERGQLYSTVIAAADSCVSEGINIAGDPRIHSHDRTA